MVIQLHTFINYYFVYTLVMFVCFVSLSSSFFSSRGGGNEQEEEGGFRAGYVCVGGGGVGWMKKEKTSTSEHSKNCHVRMMSLNYMMLVAGLQIPAGQRTMSGQKKVLPGQILRWSDNLSGR